MSFRVTATNSCTNTKGHACLGDNGYANRNRMITKTYVYHPLLKSKFWRHQSRRPKPNTVSLKTCKGKPIIQQYLIQMILTAEGRNYAKYIVQISL